MKLGGSFIMILVALVLVGLVIFYGFKNSQEQALLSPDQVKSGVILPEDLGDSEDIYSPACWVAFLPVFSYESVSLLAPYDLDSEGDFCNDPVLISQVSAEAASKALAKCENKKPSIDFECNAEVCEKYIDETSCAITYSHGSGIRVKIEGQTQYYCEYVGVALAEGYMHYGCRDLILTQG